MLCRHKKKSCCIEGRKRRKPVAITMHGHLLYRCRIRISERERETNTTCARSVLRCRRFVGMTAVWNTATVYGGVCVLFSLNDLIICKKRNRSVAAYTCARAERAPHDNCQRALCAETTHCTMNIRCDTPQYNDMTNKAHLKMVDIHT